MELHATVWRAGDLRTSREPETDGCIRQVPAARAFRATAHERVLVVESDAARPRVVEEVDGPESLPTRIGEPLSRSTYGVCTTFAGRHFGVRLVLSIRTNYRGLKGSAHHPCGGRRTPIGLCLALLNLAKLCEPSAVRAPTCTASPGPTSSDTSSSAAERSVGKQAHLQATRAASGRNSARSRRIASGLTICAR